MHSLLVPVSAPDLIEGRLLYQPLGYANAMGVLAAVGVALALGAAAHASSAPARSVAAAALVPLAATLALAQSRGAVVAFVIAIALAAMVDPQRGRLITSSVLVLPLPLVGAWLASHSAVGNAQAPASLVTREGRVVAAVLVLLCGSTALTSFVLLRSLRFARSRALIAVAAVVIVAGVVVGLDRGLSDPAGDRTAYWRAAWNDYVHHPLLGSGAGSFRVAWLRYRTVPHATVDAHNLYLQTLAELGPLGLGLLAVVVVLPLTAAARARRHPYVPAALGAYAVFVVHAGVDWDWEMPAVAVTGLLAAAVLLTAARSPGSGRLIGRPATGALLASTAVLATAAVIGLLGNSALASAVDAAQSRDWRAADDQAHAALRFAPWSSTPLLVLADVELAKGDRAAAALKYAEATRRNADDWRAWYGLQLTGTRATRARALHELERLDPLTFRPATDAS